MSNYRSPLVTDEYYHVFNRGVARNSVFLNKRDYEQAMLALSYYSFMQLPMKLSRIKELSVEDRGFILENLRKNKKCAEIISFVFMPNHFHFLVKQTVDEGISTFLSNFTNSYTRYFNTKYDRVGPLFQGTFKAVHVETDEQLLHLSRYIHLNPVTSFVIHEKDFLSYRWSSLRFYVNEGSSLVETKPVLSNFKSANDYKNFVLDQVDYAKKLQKIKHLALEDDKR
jgi:putative transposase